MINSTDNDKTSKNLNRVARHFSSLLVAINLIFLSYLIADYIYLNFDLICNLLIEVINLQKPDIFQLSLFISLISILLIFKKSRLLFKILLFIGKSYKNTY